MHNRQNNYLNNIKRGQMKRLNNLDHHYSNLNVRRRHVSCRDLTCQHEGETLFRLQHRQHTRNILLKKDSLDSYRIAKRKTE